MADAQESPKKFDETIPGGYFLGTDGEPHDAEGKPVKAVSEAKLDAAKTDAAQADAGGTTPPPLSKSELEAMDKADLQAEADRRGIAVEGSGANGNVLKSDLVDALAPAE